MLLLKKCYSLLILLFIVFFTFNCSKDEQTSTTLPSRNFLYSHSKDVAPIINDTASSSIILKLIDTSSLPQTVRDIYTLIKDYDKDLPHSGQGVNMENLFRVLAAAESWYEGNYDNCTTITSQSITAPYALFTTPNTYNCAINSIGDTQASFSDSISNVTYANGSAFDKSDANVIKGLFGYRWSPTYATDGHYEHGVVEGSYNSSSGALSLRNVHLVNYDSSDQSYGGFVVRTHVEGNVTTHAFTFSTINVSVQRSGGLVDGAWGFHSTNGYTALVGKGYSKAESAETPKYLLFKTLRYSGSPVYYCLEVGVNGIEPATILALDASGHTIDSSSNCFEYKTDVDNMYITDILTESDVPYSLDGTGTVGFSGTVLLNYN